MLPQKILLTWKQGEHNVHMPYLITRLGLSMSMGHSFSGKDRRGRTIKLQQMLESSPSVSICLTSITDLKRLRLPILKNLTQASCTDNTFCVDVLSNRKMVLNMSCGYLFVSIVETSCGIWEVFPSAKEEYFSTWTVGMVSLNSNWNSNLNILHADAAMCEKNI